MKLHVTSAQKVDFEHLRQSLGAAKSDKELFSTIVNAPFKFKVDQALIFLGIIVLLLVNKKTKTIDRIAISENDLAAQTKLRSAKRFEDIKIPLGHPTNILAQALETGKPKGTSDWQYLFVPELSAQDSRFNQIEGGIGYSAVYPMPAAREGAALIFSYYQYPEKIGKPQREFMRNYSTLVAEYLNR